jgi:cation diffusion facilitator family transporter
VTESSPTHDLHDRAARWSVGVGVAVLSLKLGAWYLTGSVALLSDALESIVNVVAAAVMLWAVRFAHLPADEDHPFGHGKAEYLSAIIEGVLIGVAAALTINAAWGRFVAPRAVPRVGEGITVSIVASVANAALGAYLLRTGRKVKSLALEADGHHVLSDVITSAGVVLGVAAARLTGWWHLDPLIAMLVALNILWVGWRLVRRAVGALMDELADPEEARGMERELDALARELGARGVSQPATASGRAPTRTPTCGLLVDPAMPVGDAHALCDALEARARALDPRMELVVHVEPDASPLTLP